MKKPNKCCLMGSYKCQIPMEINGRVVGIDFCISDIVASLNCGNFTRTAMSCCGHGKILSTIVLEDGRYLIILKDKKMFDNFLIKLRGNKRIKGKIIL